MRTVKIIQYIEHKTNKKVFHVMDEKTGEKPIISYAPDLKHVVNQILENGWKLTKFLKFNGESYKWVQDEKKWEAI